MAKLSFAGFKDPVLRPRFIIWIGIAVLLMIAIMIPVLGVTSTRWFCANACHKVQDDTITAYRHSSHVNVSCLSCHMPVNASPVVFMMHKVEALGELYLTLSNKFPLPLNAEDEVALIMGAEQCTQCHNPANRIVTPSSGMKIDHNKHSAKNIPCTVCHNRIAHKEDFAMTLTQPATHQKNRTHDNFMLMTACFRCHGQEDNSPALGACTACHTADYPLKPASHFDPAFFPKGHAGMAKSAEETVTEALKEANIATVTPEVKSEWKQTGGSKETLGQKLIPVKAVFYCGTCHRQEFCTNCHGTPIPHSDEFKAPKQAGDPLGHPAQSKVIGAKCLMCHGDNNKTNFCRDCHHGKKLGYAFNPAQPWLIQHPKAVAKAGVKPCTASCHAANFCSVCHTSRRIIPGSHSSLLWVHPATPSRSFYGSRPATPSAGHALAAKQSIESCQVCHGAAGINSPFCTGCHKAQVPHTEEFRKFHGATGRKNPVVCRNCHGFVELCSDCHHVGASNAARWINLHGSSVDKNGSESCLAKCHKKTDCQSCHTSRRVKPSSHSAGLFVRRAGKAIGNHAALFDKDSSVCTFCHSGVQASLPNSRFCNNCHRITMPHNFNQGIPQKFEHKMGFQKKRFSRALCLRCHEQTFCDNCHHAAGARSGAPWLRFHPNVVKKSGANACFVCHQETFCSDCHVNRAQGLIKLGF